MRTLTLPKKFKREVVEIAGHVLAVASYRDREGIRRQVCFAVPPDGVPTGKLWNRLEDVLAARYA
jgi:hypothetical protein